MGLLSLDLFPSIGCHALGLARAGILCVKLPRGPEGDGGQVIPLYAPSIRAASCFAQTQKERSLKVQMSGASPKPPGFSRCPRVAVRKDLGCCPPRPRSAPLPAGPGNL
jgi:hypothetical protein